MTAASYTNQLYLFFEVLYLFCRHGVCYVLGPSRYLYCVNVDQVYLFFVSTLIFPSRACAEIDVYI